MQRSLHPAKRIGTQLRTPGYLHCTRLFSMSTVKLSEEDAQFEAQVKETEKWFSSPRFAEIKRPYTAAAVVEKRGTLPVVYPCEYQAKKLWEMLRKCAAEKKPLLTMGAIDPIQMTQMAPHQEVLYVSGWACSSVLASGELPYLTYILICSKRGGTGFGRLCIHYGSKPSSSHVQGTTVT